MSYPTINQLDADLSQIISGAKNKPNRMPLASLDAARWWRGMQEKPGHYESPAKYPIRGKDEAYGYTWLYADRIKHALMKFLSLPESHQNTIISAREDEIYWRGDEIPFFMKVIDEAMKMREMGKEDYIKQAKQRLKGMVCKS